MSVPYELTHSYVISKDVLAPDLKQAILSPDSFLRFKHMLTAPVVKVSVTAAQATSGQKDAQDLLLHFSSSTPPDPLTAGTPALLWSALSTVSRNRTEATQASLFRAVRDMCTAFLHTQLRTGFDATGAQAQQLIDYVKRIFATLLDKLDNAMPFSQLGGYPSATREGQTVQATQYRQQANSFSSGVSLRDHMGILQNMIADFRLNDINENMRDWLFTENLMTMFYASYIPYFRMKFIGSYMRGDWNAAGNISDVSFYDARYAELAVYKIGQSVYRLLKECVSQDTLGAGVKAQMTSMPLPNDLAAANATADERMTALKATLTTILSNYTNAMNIRIQFIEQRLLAAHSKIAQMSAGTKLQAARLYRNDADFKFRKQSLQSLSTATASEMQRFQVQQRSFYAWVLAYVVITVVSILLIASNRSNVFMLMSAIILGFVLIFALVRAIVVAVRRAV